MAVDHTIEQTLNKDTKTKGGIIGFSLNKGAVQSWILTAHERAAILRNFKNMLQITEDLETTLKKLEVPELNVMKRMSLKFQNKLKTGVTHLNKVRNSHLFHQVELQQRKSLMIFCLQKRQEKRQP